eukprot:scaffold5576_cov131-Skeletonema_dohrnii-CCMP3373.AAC.2
MKLWVHASILKSALLANAADKKNADDITKRALTKLDSNCSTKSSFSADGLLSTRKEQWVWVLSEVVSGSTQDLFATSAHNDLTSPSRHNNANAAADATLTIRVVDPESDYADKVIEIAREHINMLDGGRGVLPANTLEENQPLPSDLTQLTHLHEPAVLDCLHRRYQLPSGWEMYTSSGPILIAINPCRMVKALYDESTMKLYQRHGEQLANGRSGAINNNIINNKDQVSSSSPPPHVFAVADSAYRGMMRGLDFARNKNSIEEKNESSALSNQSILVSGESGAGKTVTTKFLMQYLADLSRKVHSDHSTSGKLDKSSIEQRVLNSNPILEAFGNARTLRNDNSSRFGKFIEMRFSDRGRLLGAYIDTYLLEKARIVGHTCGEQTYHIFYELLAKGSLTEAMRKQLMIEGTTTADFAITTADGGQNNSKLLHNEFSDHRKMFLELRSAMGTLSFSQSEQMEIFQVVCALLHLSNLTLNGAFVDVNDGEECKLDENSVSLQRALSLLGVSYEALDSAVTTVQFKAVDELVTKNLSASQAAQAVHALIKGVYDSIFTILVGRINSCIAGASTSADTEQNSGGAFIGLLDIFGFETFQKNVFEQFCINYCNESLQQQFNRFVFKLEQQEYIREGIRWDMIEFQDNQDTLDLIEKKHAGILTILDEQCRLGMRCNDKTFVSAVYSKCMNGNTRFGADRKQQSHGKFTIRHYAGVVEYSTDGFMEKNKDEIPMETSELLSQSTCAFVRDIAQVISAKTGSQKESKSSISRVSVGKQFSGQLQKLRRRIDETHPHYVRCIKPNEQLQPNHFDSNIVVDQLRCGGILEAIRVSRAGFPQRYTFDHFVARFNVLSSVLRDRKETQSKAGKLNGISSKKKRASKTQAGTKDECEALVKLISQWILKDRENDHEVEREAEPEPEPDVSSDAVSPRSFWKNKSAGKNNAIDLSEAGIQVGATKVFLIQDTFDTIERLRGQVTMINATKISSLVRMYLTRKAYIMMLQDHRQARAQRKALFEANPFNTNTRKYRATDENLLGKVDANVEGFEIVANGERDASTNPDPTDFVWHSIGHGRFVKKRESGDFDISPAVSVEGCSSGQQSVETAGKQDISAPPTSTSAEQQSKPGSSVSQIVSTLGEKKGTLMAPVSPMSFWSSQSSPRASSDSNIIEAKNKTNVFSSTNKINANVTRPQSVKADANPNIKNGTSTNQSRVIWGTPSSPRESSDSNVVEAKKKITVGTSVNKIQNNVIRPQGIKAELKTDTNPSRVVWGAQSSPRASSDSNVVEAKKKMFVASSAANNINANVARPPSITADKVNSDTNPSRVVWGVQLSPRAASSGSNANEGKSKSVASSANKIQNNFAPPQSIKADDNPNMKKNAITNPSRVVWGTQLSPKASSDRVEARSKMSVVSSAAKIQNNIAQPRVAEADEENTDTNPSRVVWGAQSSPRTSSESNVIEAKKKMFVASSANKIQSKSIKSDATVNIKKNMNTSLSSAKVSADKSAIRRVQPPSDGGIGTSVSPRVKTNTQNVREAQPTGARPKADAFSGVKSTSNKPSSPLSFDAFNNPSLWQKPASEKMETKTPSQSVPQTSFPNHFGSNVNNQNDMNVARRQRGKGTTDNGSEKRQDSSTQHAFDAFSESSFTPNPQFNTFQKAISPRFEDQLSPASSSNHSGHQNVSVAARRRAKAMNAVTIIDNMSSSYQQMQPKPVQPATKPIAPVIAPPPSLSSSARARRNMKQKMQRSNSRTVSESASGSRSGSFSDFVDF